MPTSTFKIIINIIFILVQYILLSKDLPEVYVVGAPDTTCQVGVRK